MGASADEYDTLQFRASIKSAWDDNLFRQPSNEASDQITTASAGVRFDKPYAMQRFIADVSYVENKYQTNNFLNYNSTNYSVAWQWMLTPELSGTLSTAQAQSAPGFADFRASVQNVITSKTNQFRAEYSPYKVWVWIFGYTNTSISNSQVFTEQSGYDANTLDYGLGYNFASGVNFTFLGHKRNGQFSREFNQSLLLDNGFNEDEFELDMLFKATGKSSLSGRVAYLNRQYDNFSARDYNSWQGNLRYDVLITDKLKANVDLSRAVGSYEVGYSTYTLTDAVKLSVSYNYSDKVTLNLSSSLAQRNFKQAVVLGSPNRSDDERSIGGSMTWQPRRNVGLTLKTVQMLRNSSSGFNNFNYNDVTSSIMLDLKI